MKTLIANYSRPGENYFGGQIRNVSEGNTEKAARMIAEITGGDLFEIQQKEPYSADYTECTKEAAADHRANARPELVSLPEHMDEYDEIYLGYPIYWSDMPMAVFTFLDSADLSGKTIHPFCTHEGSGLGSSIRSLKRECPDVVIESGLAIHGSETDEAMPRIREWIESQK